MIYGHFYITKNMDLDLEDCCLAKEDCHETKMQVVKSPRARTWIMGLI